MTDKTKRRPGATNTRGGNGTSPASQAGDQLRDYVSTSRREWQGVISDLLPSGQASAIPLRDLKALTGWSGREVRRHITHERRQGIPILSDNQRGYWLADTPAEVDAFVRSMRRRAREIIVTAEAIEAAVSGQAKIDGW